MSKFLKIWIGVSVIKLLLLAPFLVEAPAEYISYNDLFVQNEIAPQLTLQLGEIMRCESNGNSLACNKQYGCGAGMGLVQLIPSTTDYCEIKLNKPINPFNADDNWECGMWLLENEGDKHWQPSQHCWG